MAGQRQKKIPTTATAGQSVCVCADPVRKISEVSKWVLECGEKEWEEEAHPQVKAQFRFEGWVVIGERRNEESNNGCALLLEKRRAMLLGWMNGWMDGWSDGLKFR